MAFVGLYDDWSKMKLRGERWVTNVQARGWYHYCN